MRNIKNLIYLGLLGCALAVGATKWRVLLVSLLAPASYFPDYPFWPLWVPLGLLVVGYLVTFLLALAIKFDLGFRHHVVAIVLVGVVIVARVGALLSEPAGTEWRDKAEMPPQLAMAEAARNLLTGLEYLAQTSDNPTYPNQASEVESLLQGEGHGGLPPSGFRTHGLPASVLVVVVAGAEGPVLEVRSGDRAGTIYYAVSEDGTHVWITLVGLKELPAGSPGILLDGENQPIVLMPGGRLRVDEE